MPSGTPIEGLCEASALVPHEGGWLVGDNEDTKELHAFDLDFKARPPVALATEVDDIEALARAPKGLWVVGSQSTNKEGKARSERERMIAPDGKVLTLDLTACPLCVEAKGQPPDVGGFNVEGAVWSGGNLWLGLRGPTTQRGHALLLRVTPAGAVAEAVEVDLNGQGIRDLAPAGDDGIFLVSGAVADGNGPHTLWRANEPGAVPERVMKLPPSTEGVALHPTEAGKLVWVTDGDGKPGRTCRTPATWGTLDLPGETP